jgi:phosphatidylglycerophosphatase C
MTTPENVLFDFDHTIIRRDAFLNFSVGLVQSEPLRLGLSLPAVALTWPGLFARRTHHPALSAMLWAATVGIDSADLGRRMDAFVARLEHDAWLHADAKTAIELHRERGRRIVVVTGCEQGLARRICERFALGELTVIGSRIEARRSGFAMVEHCVGARKLKCLARHGVRPPWSHAYSDSARDLPILRPARRVTLVNPSLRTRTRVLAELAERTEVVAW